MAWSDRQRSPFESPAAYLFPVRSFLRLIRNLLLIGVAIFGLLGVAGEPFLRWEYRYRGTYSSKNVINADYIGFSRRFRSYANEHAAGCPPVLFIPPKTPCLWIAGACLAGVLVIGSGGRGYPLPHPNQETSRV